MGRLEIGDENKTTDSHSRGRVRGSPGAVGLPIVEGCGRTQGDPGSEGGEVTDNRPTRFFYAFTELLTSLGLDVSGVKEYRTYTQVINPGLPTESVIEVRDE
jgi:hypothetical protein